MKSNIEVKMIPSPFKGGRPEAEASFAYDRTGNTCSC